MTSVGPKLGEIGNLTFHCLNQRLLGIFWIKKSEYRLGNGRPLRKDRKVRTGRKWNGVKSPAYPAL